MHVIAMLHHLVWQWVLGVTWIGHLQVVLKYVSAPGVFRLFPLELHISIQTVTCDEMSEGSKTMQPWQDGIGGMRQA